MNDLIFSQTVKKTLYQIADIIEIEDIEGLIDVDFQDDILNITTPEGVFVVNRQSAAKEIWLSSPISGPYHFKLEDGLWKSKAGDNLLDVLSKELRIDLAKSS